VQAKLPVMVLKPVPVHGVKHCGGPALRCRTPNMLTGLEQCSYADARSRGHTRLLGCGSAVYLSQRSAGGCFILHPRTSASLLPALTSPGPCSIGSTLRRPVIGRVGQICVKPVLQTRHHHHRGSTSNHAFAAMASHRQLYHHAPHSRARNLYGQETITAGQCVS
jgi:hypothetical protein